MIEFIEISNLSSKYVYPISEIKIDEAIKNTGYIRSESQKTGTRRAKNDS